MNVETDIHHVLSHFPTPAQPRDRPLFLGNAGGLSGASFWRFESELGRLVLRAWPLEFQDRTRLERIDGWLSHASDLGYVPVPIVGDHGTSIVDHAGRLWQLAPWLAGAADLDEPPSPEHVDAAFRALARFHERLFNDPASRLDTGEGLRNRLYEIETLLRDGFDRLERCVIGSPPDVCREPAIRWLTLARRVAPEMVGAVREASARVVRLQPCIRDARRDHFLFSGSTLTGIVDFGAMGVECVSADLARLVGDWLGEDQDGSLRRRAIASYISIRPLDPTEEHLLPIFERSTALLAPGHWVRWHFVEGRRFEDPRAVLLSLSRSLSNLERISSDRFPWA